ncbi:MAG TPA: filamentous hemagglutinin N-terminal domain-containing protein, partial [Leptolyngbyaceae cyanobacterium]
MPSPGTYAFLLSSLLTGTFALVAPTTAQPIIPANDNTGTIVNPNGNSFDITGGQRSGDGANLFHSFTEFNLNSGQIANFLSQPDILNILARINGGNVSYINGLIQITGGNSNLFLMNPSGIVFGANASLNIAGAFTATTANGIGFGNNWFNAVGNNNHAALVGTPNAFAFTMQQPGSIINSGNLAVGNGQDLTLLAGNIINTGSLTAPQGQITIASVPGTSIVRLSQPGFVLSLDVQNPAQNVSQPNDWTLPIASLPQMLTGGKGGNATGVTVNSDGTIQLIGSGINIVPQPATSIASGTIDTSGSKIGGTVQILGDRVGILAGNIHASGNNSGGRVLVGGDFQGKGTVPNASQTLVSENSIITANAITKGDGGRVIVWADRSTQFFGDILARGGKEGGNGGFVEVSGKESLLFNGIVNAGANLGNPGTLLLDPKDITIGTTPINDTSVNFSDTPDQPSTIPASNITDNTNTGTNVVLQANNDITVNEPIITNNPSGDGGAITLQAGRSIIVNKDIVTDNGNLTLTANETSSNGVVNANRDPGNAVINIATGVAIDSGVGDTNITIGDGAGLTNNASGDITLNGIIKAGNLSIQNNGTSAGAIVIPNSANINLTGNFQQIGDSPVKLGSNITTTGGGITFDGALTLIGNPILDTAAGNGAINLNNTINSTSGENFTLNAGSGSISLYQPVGNITPLGNIIANNSDTTWFFDTVKANSISTDADGRTFISSDITTTGNQTYNDSVRIISSAILTTTNNGNIIFNNTIDGNDGIEDLTLNAGSGNILFNGSIGNDQIINDITANSSSTTRFNSTVNANSVTTNVGGTTEINGNIDTQSNQTYNDAVIIANNITVNTNNGGEITFNNTVDGKDVSTQSLTVTTTSTGKVTFNGAVGSITKLNNLTISNDGTLNIAAAADMFLDGEFNQNTDSPVSIAGDIITSDDNIKFSGPVTLNGNVLFNPGTAGISFSSSLNAGSNPLTLKAGEIDFDGQVTGSSTLVLEPAKVDRDINIGGSANTIALDLTATDLNNIQNGFSSITIGKVDGSGIVTFVSPVTFQDPVTIRSPQGAGAIAFSGGTISGQDNASINLIANQNITTGDLTAPAGITITSNGGLIDTRAGTLNTSNASGNGGAIALNANGDIYTGNLSSNAITNGAGGNITLTSTIGKIDISTGDINSSGAIGIGGEVKLTAPGDIKTRNINTSATGFFNAGNVIITSNSGSIDTTVGTLKTTATTSNGGAVQLTAQNDVRTGSLDTSASGDSTNISGNITLRSNAGNIDTSAGTLNTYSGTAGGGAIAMTAPNNITTGAIELGSGESEIKNPLTINTPAIVNLNGDINSNGADIIIGGVTPPSQVNFNFPSSTLLTDGGNVTIKSSGILTVTKNINTIGGAINLTGTSIDSSTVNLDSSNSDGAGGNINLTAQSQTVQTGNLNSSGNSQGGQITVIAPIQITAKQINSSASQGNGGNVTLDPLNDIQVEYINAQGGSRGTGGTVDITTQRFFRATSSFVDRNSTTSSISTAGGSGGGPIVIRHAGGPTTPFNVAGDATTNGTAGNITSGTGQTVAPGSYFGPFTQGQTQVITEGAPPPQNPTSPPPQNPTSPPTQNPTSPPTQNSTSPPTQNPTSPPTQNPTSPPTQNPTSPPTQNPTSP